MTVKCAQCHHSLKLHANGRCSAQRCNCRITGITPAQAKVLEQK